MKNVKPFFPSEYTRAQNLFSDVTMQKETTKIDVIKPKLIKPIVKTKKYIFSVEFLTNPAG